MRLPKASSVLPGHSNWHKTSRLSISKVSGPVDHHLPLCCSNCTTFAIPSTPKLGIACLALKHRPLIRELRRDDLHRTRFLAMGASAFLTMLLALEAPLAVVVETFELATHIIMFLAFAYALLETFSTSMQSLFLYIKSTAITVTLTVDSQVFSTAIALHTGRVKTLSEMRFGCGFDICTCASMGRRENFDKCRSAFSASLVD
jgi:hypothetical protein